MKMYKSLFENENNKDEIVYTDTRPTFLIYKNSIPRNLRRDPSPDQWDQGKPIKSDYYVVSNDSGEIIAEDSSGKKVVDKVVDMWNNNDKNILVYKRGRTLSFSRTVHK